MKKILIPALLFTLVACGPKDKKFCECLKLSDQLTEASQEALKNNSSQEVITKIDSLRTIKNDKCADYATLDGETLLKKKADCGWKE